MDFTLVLGNTNELRCIIAFIDLGYECSIPYGNGAKYDFIVDINGNLLRIQCKNSHYVNDHGEIRKDAIQFSTISLTTNTKETIRHKYSSEQIDYFATSFDNKVYIVPVSECSTSKTLRFSPPQNNNTSYNKAEDYEISNLFKPESNYLISKEHFLNKPSNKSSVKIEHHCPLCNKIVSQKGNLCPECASKERLKCVHPSREELKELIRKNSFTQIGQQFNVTDNSVRKWCKNYQLPTTKKEINKISNENWELI